MDAFEKSNPSSPSGIIIILSEVNINSKSSLLKETYRGTVKSVYKTHLYALFGPKDLAKT